MHCTSPFLSLFTHACAKSYCANASALSVVTILTINVKSDEEENIRFRKFYCICAYFHFTIRQKWKHDEKSSEKRMSSVISVVQKKSFFVYRKCNYSYVYRLYFSCYDESQSLYFQLFSELLFVLPSKITRSYLFLYSKLKKKKKIDVNKLNIA